MRPFGATAQKMMPVIGYINGATPDDLANLVVAFRDGLCEAGYVEGQNVAIEYGWAEGHYDRLSALANSAVNRHVAIIAATSTPVALAAQKATTTIPIAFTVGGDPVKIGLGGTVEHYETTRRRKDGRVIRVSVTVSPMRDASGKSMACQ